MGSLLYRENNVDAAVITYKGLVRISERAVFISPNIKNNKIISKEETLGASKMSLKFPDLLLLNKTLNSPKHRQ